MLRYSHGLAARPPLLYKFIVGRRRANLERLARILLDEAAPPQSLSGAAEQLYRVLAHASARPEAQGLSSPTKLSRGLALSPEDAGTCVLDASRTAKFLRGISAALSDLYRRFPGQRLEIVYAGTGPFAALIVPLLVRRGSHNLFVTFIDVHAQTIRSVARVLAYFGLERYARQLVVCDATEYRHEDGVPLHLIITETMQRALTAEPQVAISQRLTAQLQPHGILIPERITVDLAFIPQFSADLAEGNFRRVGCVVEVSLLALRAGLPSRVLEIPAAVPTDSIAVYATHIRTYGRHVIAGGESGLTAPLFVWELARPEQGEQIRFWYDADGSSPRIQFERLKGQSDLLDARPRGDVFEA